MYEARIPTLPSLAQLALSGLAALLPAVLPAQVPGQEPETPENVQLSIEGDYISFAVNENEGLAIPDFIKLAERLTDRRFTFNEAELATAGQGGGKVVWIGTMRMRKDQFFSFFQTMLYIKGFAVVPRGEGDIAIYEIVSMSGPRRTEISNGAKYVPPDEIEQYRNQTGVPILTTVPLRHINATVATNSLRPFFASAGTPQGGGLTLGNVGNNAAMLLQGFGPQVNAAYQLLKLVDVPAESPDMLIRVVRLVHAAAEEIEPHLNDILNDRNRLRTQVQQGASGAPLDTSGSTQLKIATHLSLNAVILSGTAEQIREAQELIAQLDVPAEPQDGQAHVVRLKNVLAEDLRTTLNEFMRQDQQAEQQAQAGAAGAGAARRPRQTVIQAHQESNSLLVSATASKFKQVLNLIEELDQRQDQVLIEAALVELQTGDLTRFGVELGFLDIKDQGDFTRPFGFSSFGLTAFQDTDDDGLPDTRLPDFDNPLQGLTGGIISSDDFAIPILVNAIATDDRANVLSLPSVLVNNNETAYVATTEERPTTQTTQNAGTAATGVGQPRTAGITLEISPTISPNNYLRLNISLIVSRFQGAFDPNSPTGGGVIVSREIRTQVTMPSDDTMVLGGVIEDQEARSESGIPILKDIPLLGYLFRSSTDDNQKTNLYFFVTPTILYETDFQDLWQISLRRKMEAETYIGTRRMQIVDRKWTGGGRQLQPPDTLEDRGTTVDDLDRYGSNEMPYYERPGRDAGLRQTPSRPTGPEQPDRQR